MIERSFIMVGDKWRATVRIENEDGALTFHTDDVAYIVKHKEKISWGYAASICFKGVAEHRLIYEQDYNDLMQTLEIDPCPATSPTS